MNRKRNWNTCGAASLAVLVCLLAGCSKQPETAKQETPEPRKEEQPAPPPAATPAPETAKKAESPKEGAKPKTARKQQPKAEESTEASAAKGGMPDVFKVRFNTSKGDFIVEAHKDWAPLGTQRFYELVRSRYFDGARFFRVVPNFVVQFGLAANPGVTKRWDKTIPDDPVLRTNKLGAMVFATAGPNTRTTQIFINLKSNQFLDNQGFAPFGQVIEGMEVVQSLYSGYGEEPDQQAITAQGNAYLNAKYPKLDYIKKATII